MMFKMFKMSLIAILGMAATINAVDHQASSTCGDFLAGAVLSDEPPTRDAAVAGGGEIAGDLLDCYDAQCGQGRKKRDAHGPAGVDPCTVEDRWECDEEDSTVTGVSSGCFAAGSQIAGNFEACETCDPVIQGPADVCVECQVAVFAAFEACNEDEEVTASASGEQEDPMVCMGLFCANEVALCMAADFFDDEVQLDDDSDDTFAVMVTSCPDEYSACMSTATCTSFLSESMESDAQCGQGRKKRDAHGPAGVDPCTDDVTADQVAANGPEAEALYACVMNAMFPPEMMDATMAGMKLMVLGCQMERATSGIDDASDAGTIMSCQAACSDPMQTSEAVSNMEACAIAAGEDAAAQAACVDDPAFVAEMAEMMECSMACAGGRARRDGHDMSPCDALGDMLSQMPPICNRQRRGGHTADFCAAFDSANAVFSGTDSRSTTVSPDPAGVFGSGLSGEHVSGSGGPCAVEDRSACDGEDSTVAGVSEKCFAAGRQIAHTLAACNGCDPVIQGPADVCVECQVAVFAAFEACDGSLEVDDIDGAVAAILDDIDGAVAAITANQALCDAANLALAAVREAAAEVASVVEAAGAIEIPAIADCGALCQTTADATNAASPGAGDAILASCNTNCDLLAARRARGTHVVADFCQLAADAVAALQAECAKDDADVDACKKVTEIAATILTEVLTDQDQDSSAATSLAASASFVTLMTLMVM